MSKQEKTMQVLIVEPNKPAYAAEIGGSLADMQKIVGGLIQAVYPYEEPVAIICNDEGKMEGLPLNRALRYDSGEIYDIIAGTFFICGLDEDNFASLSPEYMEKFKREFSEPEIFGRVNGEIVAVRVTVEYLQDSPPPEPNGG